MTKIERFIYCEFIEMVMGEQNIVVKSRGYFGKAGPSSDFELVHSGEHTYFKENSETQYFVHAAMQNWMGTRTNKAVIARKESDDDIEAYRMTWDQGTDAVGRQIPRLDIFKLGNAGSVINQLAIMHQMKSGNALYTAKPGDVITYNVPELTHTLPQASTNAALVSVVADQLPRVDANTLIALGNNPEVSPYLTWFILSGVEIPNLSSRFDQYQRGRFGVASTGMPYQNREIRELIESVGNRFGDSPAYLHMLLKVPEKETRLSLLEFICTGNSEILGSSAELGMDWINAVGTPSEISKANMTIYQK
jgi:hypothetical protein